MIVAVCSLIGAIIPVINLTAWIGGIVGAGLAIAAIAKSRRGMGWAALLISATAFGLSIATWVNVTNAIDQALGPASVSPATPGAPASGGEIGEAPATARFGGGEAADIEGLVVTVNGLAEKRASFGSDRLLCADVTYVNNSDEQRSYASFDWKLQAPGGTITMSTYDDGVLPAGELRAGGGRVTGKVCFDDTEANGEHLVIYEPMSLNQTHVEWVFTR